MISEQPTKKYKQRGFTIIELMIATSVFSVVLLLCTFGLMQIGKLYYKGISSTRTQNTARSVLDSISQDIAFADNNIEVIQGTTTLPGMICAGHHRYSYQINSVLTDTNHVMILDNQDCTTGTTPKSLTSFGVTDQEMLGRRMRLADLQVSGTEATGYTILVKIIYGDDDLLRDGTLKSTDSTFDIRNSTCFGGAGSQFCAVSTLSTFVKKRI